jgi:hypothetical protein
MLAHAGDANLDEPAGGATPGLADLTGASSEAKAVSVADLKYREIEKAARLNPSTAQYVVKSGLVPGMPQGGGKGVHRVFTIEQAVRFALVTRLVMAGIPLAKAVQLAEYVERKARGWTRGSQGPRLYSCQRWMFRIDDEEVLYFWPDQLSTLIAPCYSISSGKEIESEYDLEDAPLPALSMCSLDLARLEKQILLAAHFFDQ